MKIMKELKKAGIGMFLTAVMASLFAMNVTSADKGYVGESETEIEINDTNYFSIKDLLDTKHEKKSNWSKLRNPGLGFE